MELVGAAPQITTSLSLSVPSTQSMANLTRQKRLPPPQDCSISPASLFGGADYFRQQFQQQHEAAGGHLAPGGSGMGRAWLPSITEMDPAVSASVKNAYQQQ